MTTLNIVTLISAVLVLSLVCHYLDAKYRWQLSAWFCGESVNPFAQGTHTVAEKSDPKDEEIAALKARIATLEAIVTEPAYALNEELKKLSRQ
ncbi:hypothetical protein FJ444_09125 [Aestuariibacter sp. GS-14]|uniref:hypothetical protein n=1 Tax=Alteromonadaceae TaxID=72275 RepID=UPI0011275556|nr:hypothetical protein [Aestuariibacter sp. GS-14]TPV59195.1 hypothetical protein FJ444_09125 [Aestuariibacter sp. GS-14]